MVLGRLGRTCWMDRGCRASAGKDEHTRVRLSWQEAENGPQRLFAEWKVLTGK